MTPEPTDADRAAARHIVQGEIINGLFDECDMINAIAAVLAQRDAEAYRRGCADGSAQLADRIPDALRPLQDKAMNDAYQLGVDAARREILENDKLRAERDAVTEKVLRYLEEAEAEQFGHGAHALSKTVRDRLEGEGSRERQTASTLD